VGVGDPGRGMKAPEKNQPLTLGGGSRSQGNKREKGKKRKGAPSKRKELKNHTVGAPTRQTRKKKGATEKQIRLKPSKGEDKINNLRVEGRWGGPKREDWGVELESHVGENPSAQGVEQGKKKKKER